MKQFYRELINDFQLIQVLAGALLRELKFIMKKKIFYTQQLQINNKFPIKVFAGSIGLSQTTNPI